MYAYLSLLLFLGLPVKHLFWHKICGSFGIWFLGGMVFGKTISTTTSSFL